jgi:hypothetical protein
MGTTSLDFLSVLKSRTVWMFIAMALINAIEPIKDTIPQPYGNIINALLAIFGIYFRAMPKQGAISSSSS